MWTKMQGEAKILLHDKTTLLSPHVQFLQNTVLNLFVSMLQNQVRGLPSYTGNKNTSLQFVQAQQ